MLSKHPSINQAKQYCKEALKVFRSSGYVVPELERYYGSNVPKNISLMKVQHVYALYFGFKNWSELCEVYKIPLAF